MYCTLYLQAVHCCLHGFRGVDYIDENKAAEAFDSRALNKSCVAQVMENSGSRVLVELIDSESDGKETINSLLLQELCSEAKLTPVLPEVSGLCPLSLSPLVLSILLSLSLPSHACTVYTPICVQLSQFILCAVFFLFFFPPTHSLELRRFQ